MATQNNVHIPDDLLTAVTQVARVEGKTPNELLEETVRQMLEVRSLRYFVSENRRIAEAQGFVEEDVPRMIEEFRREQRGR